MILYHYSNKDIKKLKVKYFGANYYTNNDRNICNIPRLFFYTDKRPEYLLSDCCYLYTVKIENKYIYKLYKAENIINKIGISQTLKELKRIGFKGVSYKIGNKDIVNLFYNIIPIKKIALTR